VISDTLAECVERSDIAFHVAEVSICGCHIQLQGWVRSCGYWWEF
jgi:hypothetical protein